MYLKHFVWTRPCARVNIYFPEAYNGLGAYLLDPSGSISNENTPQGEYWSGSYAEAEDLIDARGWALAEILEAE